MSHALENYEASVDELQRGADEPTRQAPARGNRAASAGAGAQVDGADGATSAEAGTREQRDAVPAGGGTPSAVRQASTAVHTRSAPKRRPLPSSGPAGETLAFRGDSPRSRRPRADGASDFAELGRDLDHTPRDIRAKQVRQRGG